MRNKIVTSLLLAVFFITSSCKVEPATIVGGWKPTTMILPDNMKTKENMREAKIITLTFEQSKDLLYHFHADSTFSLESLKGENGFQDAKGKYSITNNAIAINIYNTVLRSDIVKITDKELHVKSPDGVTIIYERVRND